MNCVDLMFLHNRPNLEVKQVNCVHILFLVLDSMFVCLFPPTHQLVWLVLAYLMGHFQEKPLAGLVVWEKIDYTDVFVC